MKFASYYYEATRKGLEPSIFGVTGRRDNQLRYRAKQFSRRLSCESCFATRILDYTDYSLVFQAFFHVFGLFLFFLLRGIFP